MKNLLALLKVAVVGFALFAGGKALLQNRDHLARDWRDLGGLEALKSYTQNPSVAKVLNTVGPLRELVGRFARLK